MSLPYFRDFGWEPSVLAVEPGGSDATDPLLNETVPADVTVERVPAMPVSLSRVIGVGNIALRAMPYLHAAGNRILAGGGIDLVYFSTTMFLAMPLGRVWKRTHGTPYVLDMQDPWVTDYYDTHPDAVAPPKYRLAQRLHQRLEPWTMKTVDGLIAVSPAYIREIQARYPWISDRMCTVLPFGFSTLDFDLLERRPQPNPFFTPVSVSDTVSDTRANSATVSDTWNGVFAGAVGDFMATALRILFRALRLGLAEDPAHFERVRLHFVGTSYGNDERVPKKVVPIAAGVGVERFVHEHPARAPYFQALQLMKDADGLLLIGSDDPAYTASKLHASVFARKPIVAVVHEQSVMAPPLLEAGATMATFLSGSQSEDDAAANLMRGWRALLVSRPAMAASLPAAFNAFSAREITRGQCAAFDAVVARRAAA